MVTGTGERRDTADSALEWKMDQTAVLVSIDLVYGFESAVKAQQKFKLSFLLSESWIDLAKGMPINFTAPEYRDWVLILWTYRTPRA